ncbi:MAG: FUSC family protein [Candidatus Nanopelagicales bacterium]|nr:FUSC family protein [Candidatus Nanopelagicales bacterium]
MIQPSREYLRSALGKTDGMPVAWRNSLAVFLGILTSGALGLLLDRGAGQHTMPVAIVTAMFLSLLAVAGPFFMSLRLIVGVGTLMIFTNGLAVVAVDHAWIAVLGMVIVVFCATLWTAIPLVGGLLGTFPTMSYLILLAKGQVFTGGASAGRVALASAVGVLSGILVLLIMSGKDRRSASRGLVAKAWDPQISWNEQGSILLILRLDVAGRFLLSLTYDAILSRIARGRLQESDDPTAYAAGVASQRSIATTIAATGPLVPRIVEPPTDSALAAMATASKDADAATTSYAWIHWRGALERAVATLAGSKPPRKVQFSAGSLTRAAAGAVARPESASFRYGVQRALALGVGVFIMVRSSAPDFYWVLLTIFSVLQTNASATFTRAAQYAFGTWIGAVAALILGLLIPRQAAVYVAAGLLVAGFAWLARNYMWLCVAIAAAVVLLVGSPNGDYAKWAGLRALDVTAGALVAIAISTLVLRVRPQPQLHISKAQEALRLAAQQISLRMTDPGLGSDGMLLAQTRFMQAAINLQSDIDSMAESTAVAGSLDELKDGRDRVLALASVVFDGGVDGGGTAAAASRTAVSNALKDLADQIDSVHLEPASAAS